MNIFYIRTSEGVRYACTSVCGRVRRERGGLLAWLVGVALCLRDQVPMTRVRFLLLFAVLRCAGLLGITDAL